MRGRPRSLHRGLRLGYCWSHARRKRRDIFDRTGSKVTAEGLRRIAGFYAIEADIRGTSPERRLAERQSRTAPLVDESSVWFEEQRARVSAKSRLGEALAHIARYWDGLQVFLADGRVELDANAVEHRTRPLALASDPHLASHPGPLRSRGRRAPSRSAASRRAGRARPVTMPVNARRGARWRGW